MKEVIARVVLIGVLCVSGMSLRDQLSAAMSRVGVERARVGISDRLGVTSISGIDVWGQQAYKKPPADATRILVCGVRGATARQDITRLTSVSALFSERPDVHLVGYCDGRACAQAVRQDRLPLPFTVLAHGEVIPSQAVLSADAKGNCILLDGKLAGLRTVAWRASVKTAAELAKEILE